ncbi:hypothetical protein HELRODRAFT_116782 [Helobdella robusta]|uniref:protein disulfide-isomerase n=1 Tax=Helobdella robusta TaxID=6412 RepID=T1EGH6_HELRO|nr:hypothetical protein HELRODRAFT_116782 [Helobdella robusta]ESO11400.1 hypothetical protein HELRODRAFT_116782 [Helobdella robusta]
MQKLFYIYSILGIFLLKITSCSHVVTLTDDDFHSKIPSYTVLIVKFFVPWCGHCQQFDPEFKSAASEVASKKKWPVTLAQVNCDGSGKKICEEYGVKGYPTIKIFNFGEFMFNYDGPKNSESLVKFIKFKVEPGSEKVSNLDEMAACLASLDNVVIGFFNTEKSKLEGEFHKMADFMKLEYKFAHTYSNKIMTTFGYRDEIVIFRSEKLKTPLEQSQVKYDGPENLHEMRTWVAQNYQGWAGYRTQKNTELFKEPLVVVYFHVNFDDKSSISSYYRNRVIMTARKFHRGKFPYHVTFAVSNLNEFKKELEEYYGIRHIPESKDQLIVTARDSANKKYVMDNETVFSSESLQQFAEDMLLGKLKPYIKSQSTFTHANVSHSSNDVRGDGSGDGRPSDVTNAVGLTFSKLVDDNTKDVIVQLYTPWSPQCKETSEILKKVSKKLKDEADLRFVKIDVTANEVPTPYVIKGYPSVYLAKKTLKNTPLFYEGEQTVKGYIRFIAGNSTFPLKKYDRNGQKITEVDKKANIYERKTEL